MTQETIAATPELDALKQSIRLIVAEELELDPAEIKDSADFVEEYDADSLSLITVVARIEKEVGIVVPRDRFAEMSTLEDVFAVVAERTGAGPQGE
jgi:acyl carrier protein